MTITGLILAANNRLLMMCLAELFQPALECWGFLTRLASLDWFFILQGDRILILSSSSRHELSIVSYFPSMRCVVGPMINLTHDSPSTAVYPPARLYPALHIL